MNNMRKKENFRQSSFKNGRQKVMHISVTAIFFVIILSCLSSCGNKNSQTDLKKAGLKGEVKSVAEYCYSLEYQDGVLVEKPMRFENENGVVDYTESFYNTEGMLSKYRAIWDIYMNSDVYVYDKGLLKEIRHTFNDDREAEYTRFVYNEKGQIVKKVESEDGELFETIYKYNDKGYMIHDGEYEYIYDRKGRLKEEKSEYFNKTVLAYTKSGKEKEYTAKYTDPTGYYGDEGNREAKYWVKYDKWGRVSEKTKFDRTTNEKSEYKYIYENDDKGNWIVKTIHINGEPSSRERRRITYHNDKTESNDLMFPLRIYVKEAYESGLFYGDFLENPIVRDLIIGWKSQKFYDYVLTLSAKDVIFHKNVEGQYHIDAVNKENGCGSKIICNGEAEIYMTFDVYLMGIPLDDRGEFDVQPWQKGYHTDEYGEIIENRPVYFLTHPFYYYWGNNQSKKENVQIMLDVYGLRFVNTSFSNFSHASLRIIKQNGQEWIISNDFSGEVVRVGWDNDEIFKLLNILSSEDIKICIDCRFAGYKCTYFADFSHAPKTQHAVLEYMYEVGATDISRISRNK